jgi:hypothetical protein
MSSVRAHVLQGMNSALFHTTPPLVSHFEHGYFILAQANESLRTGEALNSLTLDESLSDLSIKLLKTAS